MVAKILLAAYCQTTQGNLIEPHGFDSQCYIGLWQDDLGKVLQQGRHCENCHDVNLTVGVQKGTGDADFMGLTGSKRHRGKTGGWRGDWGVWESHISWG